MGLSLGQIGSFQHHPESAHAVAVKGRWYICNGLDRMRRHDVKTQQFDEAGMLPPLNYPTAAAGGAGEPNGTYQCVMTEYDALHDIESDPSPPFEIAVVNQAIEYSAWPAVRNASTTHFRVYRSIAGSAFVTPEMALANADLTVIAMARVVHETVIGLGTVSDNYADTGVGSITDRMYDYGVSFHNGEPPTFTYPVLCRGRLFGWGQRGFHIGTVDVTYGSKYIFPGPNNLWNRSLIGQHIVIGTDTRSYEIVDLLDTSPAALKIGEDYAGETADAANYHTYADDGKLVWSRVDNPEGFPAGNKKYIAPGQGLKATGLTEFGGFPILLTADQSWLYHYGNDPGQSGTTQEQQLSATIGCVSHNTIAHIQTPTGPKVVWLSRFGIAATALQGVDIASDPPFYPGGMRSYFDDVKLDSKGEAPVACGVNYAPKNLYICALPTGNSEGGCDEVVVWDYKNNNFWIWKFKFEIYSMRIGKKWVADPTNANKLYRRDVVLMGSNGSQVFYWPEAENDGASRDDDEGTLSGTVSDSDATSLTDINAEFMVQAAESPPGLRGLVGAYVTVERASDGELQHKEIIENTATLLEVNDWDWTPTIGDSYWIGEIENYYKTPKIDFGSVISMKQIQNIHFFHDIEEAGSLKLKCWRDQDPTKMNFEDGDEIDLASGTDPVHGRTMTATQKGRVCIPVNADCYQFQWEVGNRKPNEPWTLNGAAMKFDSRED